jgi:hypothetical protein
MYKNIFLFGDLYYFLYGFDGAYLTAGMCYGYQYGFFRDSLFNGVRVHKTLFVNREIGNNKTAFFEKPGRVQDRMVLHPRNQHMLALILLCKSDTPQGKVIRFSAACGKDDFRGLRVDKTGNFFSRSFNGIFSPCAVFIDTQGITEVFFKIRHHHFEHIGMQGVRCNMVKVTLSHNHLVSFLI